jgi:hypothetical protein
MDAGRRRSSIQALLDGVGAVDANGLPGGGDCGLVHGAFDAVEHEVYGRVGSRPSGGQGRDHSADHFGVGGQNGEPQVRSNPKVRGAAL